MKSVGMDIRKNRIFNLLLVLSISLGFIALQFRNIDTPTVWEGFKNARISWLIIGMFIMCLYWLLESLVLYKMAKKVHKQQTLWQSIKITMVGQFFNTITPFSSGGQPAQLYMMVKNKIGAGVGSSILLIKFIVFQAMLVLSSIVVLLFGYGYLQNKSIPQLSMLIIIGFILNTVVIITLITVAKSKRVASFIAHMLLKPISFFVKKERYTKWENKLDQKLYAFHVESNRMSFDSRLLLECSLLTILQLWLFFSIPFFIMHSVGMAQVNVFQVIAFHSFIMMFSSLIPIPGGSGGAEYSFSLLFGLVLSPARLLLCLFFWRFITYYSCLLFGSFFLIAKRK